MKRIYLDNAATTPLDKKVKKAMDKASCEIFGNPSSVHKEGIAARTAIEDARAKVADFFDAHSDEIFFTSGGVESNNLAILGVFKALEKNNIKFNDCHAITSAIEHSSVLDTFRSLESMGLAVTYVGVNEKGIIDPKDIKESLKPETRLVSIMYANNEVGSVQPIQEIAKVVRDYKKEKSGVYPFFHTDAAQALNYLDVNVLKLGVDMLSGSASKIYGPKGAGMLFVKRNTDISPIVYGGGQEGALRPGTENTSSIVGCGEAVSVTAKIKEKETARMKNLNQYFISEINKNFPEAVINSNEEGLPNIVNVSFPNTESEELVLRLDAKGIACAGKSACKTEDEEVSYVVNALGEGHYPESAARFSMGRDTRKGDINYVVRTLKAIFDIIIN